MHTTSLQAMHTHAPTEVDMFGISTATHLTLFRHGMTAINSVNSVNSDNFRFCVVSFPAESRNGSH